MTLAIIGSRTATDYARLEAAFQAHYCRHVDDAFTCGWTTRVTAIVSGGARGADLLGARLAKEYGLTLTEFIPDWEKHGKRAGFLRNEDIIAAAEEVLCLWDGVSRGTANSLSIAKRLKKTTVIVYF